MKNHENKVRKQIKKFIRRNFLFLGKEEERTIEYHLARIIDNKSDALVTLKKNKGNKGFVGFDSYGKIVSIDDRIIYICGWK